MYCLFLIEYIFFIILFSLILIFSCFVFLKSLNNYNILLEEEMLKMDHFLDKYIGYLNFFFDLDYLIVSKKITSLKFIHVKEKDT